MKTPSDIDAVPDDLYELILELSARPGVHSVSCPLQDFSLWRELVAEQVRRSVAMGIAPQEAFRLNGPDSGIHLVSDESIRKDVEWGGEIHIPYEGVCGGDVFIQPDWFGFMPEQARLARTLSQAVFGDFALDGYKTCNYLLTRWKKLGEIACATRIEVGDWVLYVANVTDEHLC